MPFRSMKPKPPIIVPAIQQNRPTNAPNRRRFGVQRIPCPYHKVQPVALKVPRRQKPTGYVRTPFADQTLVRDVY